MAGQLCIVKGCRLAAELGLLSAAWTDYSPGGACTAIGLLS